MNESYDGPTRVTDAPDQGDSYDRKHSGVGIASFIIALVAWIMGIASFMAAMPALMIFAEGVNPENPLMDEQQLMLWLEANPSVLVLFVVAMASGGLSFIGLVFGLIGLFQKERKKLFPVLGTLFNGLPIVGYFFLFLTGLMLG